MARSSKRAKEREGQREQTQPAEEWGERVATGRAIAREGKSTGPVPVATEQLPAQPEVVTPPAPPGESLPEAVQKTQAVADAMAQLDDRADPKRVAQAVKAQTGIDLDPGEAAAIVRTLRERAVPPPLPPLEEDPEKTPAIEQLPDR